MYVGIADQQKATSHTASLGPQIPGSSGSSPLNIVVSHPHNSVID